MIRRCLIVDTETTGLDPKVDTVIELGAVLYDVVNQCSLVSFSTLIRGESNAAESVNRIPVAAIRTFDVGLEIRDAFHSVSHPWSVVTESLIDDADVIVAHNAEFDRSFLSGAPWNSLPFKTAVIP